LAAKPTTALFLLPRINTKAPAISEIESLIRRLLAVAREKQSRKAEIDFTTCLCISISVHFHFFSFSSQTLTSQQPKFSQETNSKRENSKLNIERLRVKSKKRT
jgi:hypothetical protein